MPMYEYECGSCGRRFEQLQRITEDALTTDPDPACGGPVRRVIQPVGIIFKGSGFYVNDSRKASSSSSASTSGSSDAPKPDSKSESKPESKSEPSASSSSSSDSKPAAAAAS